MSQDAMRLIHTFENQLDQPDIVRSTRFTQCHGAYLSYGNLIMRMYRRGPGKLMLVHFTGR